MSKYIINHKMLTAHIRFINYNFIKYLFFLFSVINVNKLKAQDFLNNDLDGALAPNSVPTFWQNVPHTDINCLAVSIHKATPDITYLTGPSVSNGLMGNPYSGDTFVSGLFGGATSNIFHEGIMQTVSGFNIGCSYDVNFFQAVVKQTNTDFLDSSGSWAVYVDNTLIGVSAPTLNQQPSASTSLKWDFRSLSFVATLNSHTIKFLPADDDNDQSTTNRYGGLRMGIDSIYISSFASTFNIGDNTVLCKGDSLVLNAFTPNGSYQWQDNSTSPTYTVSKEGVYWVKVTVNNCDVTDTINIETQNCDIAIEMPNVFTPNNDGINDYFYPIKTNGINHANLSIYNRWGILLHETNNILVGWDGTYNDNYSSSGTYFWIIRYTTIKNESKVLKGTLELIK